METIERAGDFTLSTQTVDLVTGHCDKVYLSVKSGKITSVVERNLSSADPSAINLENTFVLPGLVDLHQHTCENADPNQSPTRTRFFDPISNLLEALSIGVTTVREVGSINSQGTRLRGVLRSRQDAGPEIVSCGRLITYPGGHGSAMGVEVRTTREARDAVKRNLDDGADLIKVTSDPADPEAQVVSGENQAFSVDILDAIVDEAHGRGATVACHTYPSVQGIDRALAAGVDTLEHAVPFNDKQIALMLLQRTIIVPTVVAAADEFRASEVELLFGIGIEQWNRLATLNYPSDSLRRDGSATPGSIVEWAERLSRHLPEAMDAGVNIGVGTDAGCVGTGFKSAVREVALLSAMGLGPAGALKAGTHTGAEALQRRDIGSVKSGMRADLVFVDKNPITDLAVMESPLAVMANGKWVSNIISDEILA